MGTRTPSLFDLPLPARSPAMTHELESLLQCIAERYSQLLQKQDEERVQLAARHDVERSSFKSDLAPMSSAAPSAQGIEPVPDWHRLHQEAVVAVREFPDEQHLYPGGQLLHLRGGEERPRRWRGDSVEYFYKRGHKCIQSGPEIGTREDRDGEFFGRWFTVQELNSRKRAGGDG